MAVNDRTKDMTFKIGVIGDKESVIGFRAVGFSVFTADGAIEAEGILANLARENYAVIYITEDLVRNMQPALAAYRTKPIPAVIAIPGKGGSDGFGISQIKKAVERAVGADILFKDN